MSAPNDLPDRILALAVVATLRELAPDVPYAMRTASWLENVVLDERWLDAPKTSQFYHVASARWRLAVKLKAKLQGAGFGAFTSSMAKLEKRAEREI